MQVKKTTTIIVEKEDLCAYRTNDKVYLCMHEGQNSETLILEFSSDSIESLQLVLDFLRSLKQEEIEASWKQIQKRMGAFGVSSKSLIEEIEIAPF